MKKLIFIAMVLSMTAYAQQITFEPSGQSLPGTIWSEISVGDIYGNGRQDICLDGGTDSSGSSPYHSYVFGNGGDGTLNITSPFEASAIGFILVDDFNNSEGDDYLKFGERQNGTVFAVLMRNNGDGTFTDVTPSVIQPLPNSKGVSGDFDKDGDVDFIVHGGDNAQAFTHYYENIGNFNFIKHSFTGMFGGDMIAGNLDNNPTGFMSVIHAGISGGAPVIFILRNNNGVLTEESINLDAFNDGSMVFIDINGDTFLDYGSIGNYATGYGNDFKLNDGNGNFPGNKISVPFGGLSGSSMLTFNANNQGKEELFVAGRMNDNTNITRLYKINESNDFVLAKVFQDAFSNGAAVAVDTNNDQKLDIFCSGNRGGGYPFEEGKTWLYLNTTSLGVDEFNADALKMYPNPTTGLVNIDLPNNVTDVQIIVTDMTGRNIPILLVNGQFDISDFSAGVYLATMRSDNASVTKRIVKQ
ncbi:MAG: T9SS type A sorting domain-containing protein [Flavobacteriaceae bacterium]|nr:T9SS type A sorting domain-containing protein [Flavobacteriaceae bacterium]